MKEYKIVGEHLTKQYKNRKVVNDVSMHVVNGEIYGLVGPNGAGKSTMLKMLLNLTKPDMGEFTIDGVSVQKNGYQTLRKVGAMKDIHEQNAAYIEIETDNAEKAGYILDEILQIKQFRVISDGIIQVFDLSKSGKEISSALMKYGIGVESIQKKQNSLEEFFFKTTRRSLAYRR